MQVTWNVHSSAHETSLDFLFRRCFTGRGSSIAGQIFLLPGALRAGIAGEFLPGHPKTIA